MQGIESLGYEVKDQPLVPDGGMQQLKGAADLLAEFGRNGDTYVVHAAEGETVLPLEVLESNPKLKTMIYQQMEELGLQPERYVVGNEMNSLNPVTGQPEFFFKKLFKKIKKVGKKVINIAKKVAPIVLPLIAPVLLPAAPLFLTAGIGSLAGNLIAGNDFKTSLKNAVLAGGMAGVGSALSAGSLSGFTASPESMGIPAKLGEFFGQTPTQTSGVIPVDTSFSPVTNEVFGSATANVGIDPIALRTGLAQAPAPMVDATVAGLSTGITPAPMVDPSFAGVPTGAGVPSPTPAVAPNVAQQTTTSSIFDDPFGSVKKLYGEYLSPSRPGVGPDAGILTKYGPLLAVGGAGILAADALFPADEGEELDTSAFEKTGQDLLEEDIASGRFQYGFNPRTFYGSNPFYQRFTQARQGGEIEGPGTGTSDSIPAMLSDGEFVMTAKAVRGAGGNDREKGAKRMYAMMRQFEKEAAA